MASIRPPKGRLAALFLAACLLLVLAQHAHCVELTHSATPLLPACGAGLDFGSLTSHVNDSKTVTIENTGPASVIIKSVECFGSPFTVQSSIAEDQELAPASTVPFDVLVSFSEPTDGEVRGHCTVGTEPVGGGALTETSFESLVTVCSPTVLVFIEDDVGGETALSLPLCIGAFHDVGTIAARRTTITRQLRLQNSPESQCDVTFDDASMATVGPFSFSPFSAGTVAPGANATWDVTFSSGVAVNAREKALLKTNALTEDQTIPLRGTAVDSLKRVSYEGAFLANNDNLFITIELGPTEDVPLNIVNQGGYELVVSSITVTGSAEASMLDPAGFTVPASSTTPTALRLAPVTSNNMTLQVVIASDDLATPTFTINVLVHVIETKISLLYTSELTPGQTLTFLPVKRDLLYVLPFSVMNVGLGQLDVLEPLVINDNGTNPFALFSPLTKTSLLTNDEGGFVLSFSSAELGVFSTQLSVMSDDPYVDEFNITVVIEVVAPILELRYFENPPAFTVLSDGDSIDLGEVYTGIMTNATFAVLNTGKVDLELTDADASGGVLAVTQQFSPSLLPFGSNSSLVIAVVEPEDGLDEGGFFFTSNDPSAASVTITVSYTGVTPVMVVASAGAPLAANDVIDLGQVTYNVPHDFSFNVTNTGTGSLLLPGATIGGAEFSVFQQLPASLPAGASAELILRMVAPTAGPIETTLLIPSNHLERPEVPLNITATIVVPSISVEFGGTPVVSGTAAEGPITQRTSAIAQRTFTIENTGLGDLFISSTVASPDPPLTVTAAPSATLLPSDTSSVTVNLTSAVRGTFATTLTIASSDPTTPSFEIPIDAVIVDAVIGVSVNGSAVATGGLTTLVVACNDSELVTVTVSNTGDFDLTLSGQPTVTGDALTVDTPLPALVVAPAATVDMVLNVSLLVCPGSSSGSVVFASDDPATPTYTVLIDASDVAMRAAPAPTVHWAAQESRNVLGNGLVVTPANHPPVDANTTFVIGTARVYEEQRTTLTITNTGSDMIVLEMFGTDGLGFGLYSAESILFGADVPPGASTELVLSLLDVRERRYFNESQLNATEIEGEAPPVDELAPELLTGRVVLYYSVNGSTDLTSVDFAVAGTILPAKPFDIRVCSDNEDNPAGVVAAASSSALLLLLLTLALVCCCCIIIIILLFCCFCCWCTIFHVSPVFFVPAHTVNHMRNRKSSLEVASTGEDFFYRTESESEVAVESEAVSDTTEDKSRHFICSEDQSDSVYTESSEEL